MANDADKTEKNIIDLLNKIENHEIMEKCSGLRYPRSDCRWHTRKYTPYEQLYHTDKHNDYEKIADYIVSTGLYLPKSLLNTFDKELQTPHNTQIHQAKIIHELVTEHFYNRTWIPRGKNMNFHPTLAFDKNKKPIQRHAFGITLNVYIQEEYDELVLFNRRKSAEQYSESSGDIDENLLQMYDNYPEGTRVNPFQIPINMGPVYHIKATNEKYKQLKESCSANLYHKTFTYPGYIRNMDDEDT